MRNHQSRCFVGLAVVLALAAGPGCNKSSQKSGQPGSSASMSAEAMLAPEPDLAAQMAPSAPEPVMTAEAMDTVDAMDAMAGSANVMGPVKVPRKLGPADYKAQLRELTSIQISGGSGKLANVAIAGKCATKKECARMLRGSYNKRSGGGFGDLDFRGRGVSGGAVKRGPVRGISGRVPVKKPLGTPRSKISSFVPPVKLNGTSGARVRAKIRARIYGLRPCHQRLLSKNPKAVGSVKISFTIATNGRVSGVSVTGILGAVVSCVRAKVSRWHLGKVPRSISYGPFVVRFTIKK